MNSKRILISLTLALFVSVLCTWLVSRKLTVPPPPTVQNQPDARYVTPSRALRAGEILQSKDIELVAWPGNDPLDGAFLQPAEVIGREVLFPLAKGQPILDRDLSAAGSGTGLASKIPDGMRAIALHSDEVVGVAGFLVPGSHLDVLVTYHSDLTPEPITATVLQNAVVLAAGQQLEPDPTGKTSDVTVVTLLLTPEQAERAVLASTQGTIHFVLRNGADSSRSGGIPMLLSQLSGPLPAMARPVPPPAAAAIPAAPKRQGIETILNEFSDARSAATPDGGARP
ncbi:MAG: Flp pilus assembly protein CpaB [Acidobacteriaceae bacterium]|jgi:pilus assembly protein CpaB